MFSLISESMCDCFESSPRKSVIWPCIMQECIGQSCSCLSFFILLQNHGLLDIRYSIVFVFVFMYVCMCVCVYVCMCVCIYPVLDSVYYEFILYFLYVIFIFLLFCFNGEVGIVQLGPALSGWENDLHYCIHITWNHILFQELNH